MAAISKSENPINAGIDPVVFLVKHNSFFVWIWKIPGIILNSKINNKSLDEPHFSIPF